jgi:hypothetical protein
LEVSIDAKTQETNKVLLHKIRNFVTQNIFSHFLKREELHIAY